MATRVSPTPLPGLTFQAFHIVGDLMPAAIIIVEIPDNDLPQDVTLCYANEATLSVCGYDLRLLVGQRFGDAFPDFLKTKYPTKYIEICHNQEKHFVDIFRYGDKRLKKTYYEINASAMDERHVVICMNDHNAIVAKEVAEQASSAKTRFLSEITHELRTPANAIQGMLEMSLEEEDLTLSCRDNLKTAFEACKSFVALLDDLIDTSAIEEGQTKIDMREFDFYDVVYSLLNSYQHTLKTKDILLNLNYPPDLPRLLWGDVKRIRQIISNLLENAIKYTSQGYVQIAVNREGDEVVVKIKDSGCGIDLTAPGAVDNLFNRYYRAGHNRTNSIIQGRGLGLWISYKLTRLLHGTLDVESEVEQGSTFIFKFPFCTLDPDVTKMEDKNSELDHKPSKTVPRFSFSVLVAEDVPDNQKVIRKMLEYFGVQVKIVNNGDQCVKTWQKAVDSKEPFDLILMDCRMPLMDGCEAATNIRENEARQNLDRTLIVGCSASVSEGKRRCIQAGMDDYVIKPVTLDKVKKVLQHVDVAKKENPYQSYDRLVALGILDRLSEGLELDL